MNEDFRKEVEHVARLARLELGQEEREMMVAQLGQIIDAARKVQELDTSAVEPTSHVSNLQASMRKDEITPSLSLVGVMQNAPSRWKDFFRVPGIPFPGEEQDS